MKILIADAFSESHLAGFQKLGLEVDYRPQLPAAELLQALSGVSILVVRSRQVSRKAIEAYAALAFTTWAFDWDFDEAERLFVKSFALNPNYPRAREWYAPFWAF